MEELQKAVEKLSPEDIKKALENLDISAQEMLEKLERTASLLKQIQKEQQMEEVVRKSQELMNEQKDLNDDTAAADSGDEKKMDELAGKQDELAKKADELKDSMDKMAEMSEGDQTSQQMQELSKQLDEEQGPQENMKQASKELQQQQQQGAMQQQQEAMDKLISLFQSTQKAQQQMQAMQMQQMAANFQKFARQTLDLSFKQEGLVKSLMVTKEEGEGGQTQDAAKMQMSYLRATEKVADEITKMAGSSMQVPPALMDAIGKTLDHMQNSVLFLEQNKSFMSTAYANNAVQSLNEATIEMMRSAQQCSQGNPRSQGSGQSAMQMMQQMIPRQQDVLKQTQSMMEMQMLGEKMRQEQQAALDRLAGQQRSLKEVAEQIQKSLDEKSDHSLGRLDRTIEDMEAVVEALKRGDLGDDLVNREQRILSRLLDAQRSVNTRDYEKKREAETAADVYSRSLGAGTPEAVSQSLREEIRRAMQLKAPGEFEELIKLYFRALADESVAPPKVESN
jgi:myosin heavy subunit